MRFREHQIDWIDRKVYTLTKEDKEKLDRMHYRNNWYRHTNSLSKVNTDSLVGKSLQHLSKKYLGRLHGEYHSIYWMLHILGIDLATYKGGSLMLYTPVYNYHNSPYGWRNTYYIDPITNVVCVIKKRYNYKGWRKRFAMSKSERMKEFYEDKHRNNKYRRDKKLQRDLIHDDLLHNITRQRKEKEEKINMIKLISHGFDPVLSFRNFPKIK